MNEKLNLHDTCGVHNLHGMPGLLGAIAGVVASKLADREDYKGRYVLFVDYIFLFFWFPFIQYIYRCTAAYFYFIAPHSLNMFININL